MGLTMSRSLRKHLELTWPGRQQQLWQQQPFSCDLLTLSRKTSKV